MTTSHDQRADATSVLEAGRPLPREIRVPDEIQEPGGYPVQNVVSDADVATVAEPEGRAARDIVAPAEAPETLDGARSAAPRVTGLLGVGTALSVLVVVVLRANFSMEALADDYATLFRHFTDLEVYQLAGRAVAGGSQLYAGPMLPGLPFTYPPFAGAVFQWIGQIPYPALALIWQGCSFAALVAVILACLDERGYRIDARTGSVAFLAAIAALALEPVRSTFYYGQINVFLMLLVALDLLRRRRSRLGGVGIGLAAGLKLTPAIFGVVFLVQRRWREAAVSMCTFAATVVVGFVFVSDAGRFWLHSMFDSSRVGDHANFGAQSMKSTMIRAWGLGGTWPWLLAVAVASALLLVALAGAVRWGNMSLAMGLAGVGMTLISPFSWQHHWVYVVPLAICVWDASLRLGRGLWARFAVAQQWETTRPRTVRAASWLVAQVFGCAGVAVSAVLLLPFVSYAMAWDLSLFSARVWGGWQYQGWYVYPGLLLLIAVALASVVDSWRRRRRSSRCCVEAGEHKTSTRDGLLRDSV